MPYYQCPKCGSKDSYSGTEIVSEHKHKSGHMIAGPENSLSMTPVMRVGGSNHTEHKQLTVQKCRRCDTLLGDKDLHYTKQERLEIRLEEVRREKEEDDTRLGYKFLLGGLVYAIICIFISTLIISPILGPVASVIFFWVLFLAPPIIWYLKLRRQR